MSTWHVTLKTYIWPVKVCRRLQEGLCQELMEVDQIPELFLFWIKHCFTTEDTCPWWELWMQGAGVETSVCNMYIVPQLLQSRLLRSVWPHGGLWLVFFACKACVKNETNPKTPQFLCRHMCKIRRQKSCKCNIQHFNIYLICGTHKLDIQKLLSASAIYFFGVAN